MANPTVKVDRLLAEATALKVKSDPDPWAAAYGAEFDRRCKEALEDLDRIIPADLDDTVTAHLDSFPESDNWWYSAGGVWDWHRSLVWCHSTIPEGMTETATRANLKRFMSYANATMTSTCYSCGLATPCPWVGAAAGRKVSNLEPGKPYVCTFCGSDDLVEICRQHGRPDRPWHDDWTERLNHGFNPNDGNNQQQGGRFDD